MPAAEVETTHTNSPPVDKDVEKFPEKCNPGLEDKDKAVSTAEEGVETPDDSRKMTQDDIPEKGIKEEIPKAVSGNEEQDKCKRKESAKNKTEGEKTKMAVNSKRKSVELKDATNQTNDEEESPSKKRKSNWYSLSFYYFRFMRFLYLVVRLWKDELPQSMGKKGIVHSF